jgi:hypothetical protein
MTENLGYCTCHECGVTFFHGTSGECGRCVSCLHKTRHPARRYYRPGKYTVWTYEPTLTQRMIFACLIEFLANAVCVMFLFVSGNTDNWHWLYISIFASGMVGYMITPNRSELREKLVEIYKP